MANHASRPSASTSYACKLRRGLISPSEPDHSCAGLTGPHEGEELLTPPQTECSRITPCPLPFLHSGSTLLARIGVIRLLI